MTNYYHSCNNMLMLNGVPSQRAVYHVTSMNYDVTGFEDIFSQYVRGGFEYSLDLEFVISENYQILEKIDIDMVGKYNFVSLGSGWVCQYCGDYNVAGLIKCVNCGGVVSLEQYSRVQNFPFIMTNMSYDSLGVTSIVKTTFVFLEYCCESVPMSLGMDIRSLPYSYSLNENFYVCQYCGKTVEREKKCDGCGGGRLPMSEVVQMDTTCLYCGSQIVGGVICPTCGGFLKSIAYRELRDLN